MMMWYGIRCVNNILTGSVPSVDGDCLYLNGSAYEIGSDNGN